MIGEFLCKLGFHKPIPLFSKTPVLIESSVRRCSQCGYLEEILYGAEEHSSRPLKQEKARELIVRIESIMGAPKENIMQRMRISKDEYDVAITEMLRIKRILLDFAGEWR
ncbi:MAG: hypothetical protein PHH85_02295 [Candidatus Methanoperedens sp.]|nr:hypothetical protein [Candidatus Methanoperedens sp.]